MTFRMIEESSGACRAATTGGSYMLDAISGKGHLVATLEVLVNCRNVNAV